MSIIRAFVASDIEPVSLIMASCTRELRKVYVPKSNVAAVVHNQSHSSRIVAVDCTGTIVGVAECIGRASVFYVQGIAVAPTHRRCGIATGLLAYSALLAREAVLPTLEIATVKETGNVEIFRRLGFLVIDERISDRFWSHDERPVIEVKLKRHVD